MEYCVYPEYRGNGTGKKCAKALLSWAKEHGSVLLLRFPFWNRFPTSKAASRLDHWELLRWTTFARVMVWASRREQTGYRNISRQPPTTANSWRLVSGNYSSCGTFRAQWEWKSSAQEVGGGFCLQPWQSEILYSICPMIPLPMQGYLPVLPYSCLHAARGALQYPSNIIPCTNQSDTSTLIHLFFCSGISKAERYDIKGKKYIASPFKYYFTDVGLRNAQLNFRQQEENHIMENIIYNELLIRGFKIWSCPWPR